MCQKLAGGNDATGLPPNQGAYFSPFSPALPCCFRTTGRAVFAKKRLNGREFGQNAGQADGLSRYGHRFARLVVLDEVFGDAP